MRREAEKDGGVGLYQMLKEIDPVTARRLHPNDLFRVIRALEVWECSGKPISAQHLEHGFREQPLFVQKIGLRRPRSELHERIDRRVEAMMELGLLDEVKGLLSRGYGPHLKSMQSLGYRHMLQYICNGLEFSVALRTMKRDTRRYAKRQMTWLRRDQEINWFYPEEVEDIVRFGRQFLDQPYLK